MHISIYKMLHMSSLQTFLRKSKGHVRIDGVQSSFHLHAGRKNGISIKDILKHTPGTLASSIIQSVSGPQLSSLLLSLPETDRVHEITPTMIIQAF